MPAIFTRKAGTVLAITSNEDGVPPQAGVIRIEGINGELKATGDIVVTGFSAPSSVNYKATSTIGGPKYLTVFGDNLTQILINTILFQGDGCSGELKGILSGFYFYARNRLRPDSAPVVKIAYGGVSFEGFLVGYDPTSQINAGMQTHVGVFKLIGWVNSEWFSGESVTSLGDLGSTDIPGFNGGDPTYGTPGLVPVTTGGVRPKSDWGVAV